MLLAPNFFRARQGLGCGTFPKRQPRLYTRLGGEGWGKYFLRDEVSNCASILAESKSKYIINLSTF